MATDSNSGASAHSDDKSNGDGKKPVVVGIGASAGGIRALQSFFESLPENPGAAFVVGVHLDPQSHSELSNILGAKTKMPVVQVGAAQELQANHVYVIAPGRRLCITDQDISSAEFAEPRGQRAPIDLFFRSLAERHGDGFAVVLTGAGSDGAVGVKEVKEVGGIILVQDPASAEYPSMPRAAIATGTADFILPVPELATTLVELIRNKDNRSVVDVQSFDEELVHRILAHVHTRTGHDFSQYKRSTILRRIFRRMQINKTDRLEGYFALLHDHAEEAQALLGDLLISVTTFFRDKDVFEAVKTHLVPDLFTSKHSNDQIRIWVPGCATGEEAYTIAILLVDEAARHDFRPSIQIFASDLDARALAFAREGTFPSAIEADVSEDQLRRYFTHDGDLYRVRRELRDIIVFASHSVLKDPPFSHIDFISCRNLLIYLDRDVQAQVCSTFHYALNPGGYLLLGSSESADSPPGLFRVVDRKNRIYQSTAELGDKPRLLPRLLCGPAVLPDQHPHSGGGFATGRSIISEAALHRQALERIAPPSILVDRMHRVIHLSDHAGRYLQPSGGVLSGDAIDLVRPELRLELRSALHRAFERRQATLTLPIPVQFNGKPHRVLLQVRPVVQDEETDPRNAVLLFLEGEEIEQSSVSPEQTEGNDETTRLREELHLTQARLRTTLEESEAANEELRAANEELQSINEEHRSTAEELETIKEELQSTNEELQTVNSELKSKLESISRAHGDLQNLMAATDFGTLFLDSSLRIKRFTDPVTLLFRITPNDEGRSVMDFTHQLDYADLGKDAQTVLTQLVPRRREIHSQSNRWFDIRMWPYRTVDDKIDGVVITFVDITEHRQVEETLRERERQLRQQKRLVELSHDPIFVWDFDGGILEWNRGCQELYGYTRDEAIGQRKEQLLATAGGGFSFADVKARLIEKGSWSGELIQRTKSGDLLTVESRLQLESFEGRRLVLESARDITERKAWEQHQSLLLRELSHRVKNTMAVVQSIIHQTLRSQSSGRDLETSIDGRLLALASAHDLLAESNWRGADLAALARHQLAPYGLDSSRFSFEGPSVSLPPEIAANFSLVLHELATNAAKYGSLSIVSGKIHLSWEFKGQPPQRTLMFRWQEKEGPPVTRPEAVGFGSTLIENAIPNATVRREFRPDGLLWTVELPLLDGDHGTTAASPGVRTT
ncbi:MAG TPA: chemotaxis protein CheB [Methylocella sp.]|nr:chemotaxis protein CheB [Methylocella sp.]